MNALMQPVPQIRYFDSTAKKFLSADHPLIKDHEVSVVATNIDNVAYEAMGSVTFFVSERSFNRSITSGQDLEDSKIVVNGNNVLLPKMTLEGVQTPVVLMKFTVPKVAEQGLLVLCLKLDGVPSILKNRFTIIKETEGTVLNLPLSTGSSG